MSAAASLDSTRKVLDSFTWFAAEPQESDEDLNVLLEKFDRTWLSLLGSCGQAQDDLVEVVLKLGSPPEVTFDDGRKLYTVSLSGGTVCERVHLEKILVGVSYDWKTRLRSRNGKSFCMPSTLHRVDIITKGENDRPVIVGITVRIGRSLPGIFAQMCPWLLKPTQLASVTGQPLVLAGRSALVIGRPGAGKTSILRELANCLSRVRITGEQLKSVVLVDKVNEFAGQADTPHPSIGDAQWMPCDNPDFQAKIMMEAVENTSPDRVIVDEICDAEEVESARAMVTRGVVLIAAAQGNSIADVLNCKVRSMLLGGVQPGRLDTKQRAGTPVFDIAIEIVERERWIIHSNVKDSVDRFLRGEPVDAIEFRPGVAVAVLGYPSASGLEYCTACPTGRCSLRHTGRPSPVSSSGGGDQSRGRGKQREPPRVNSGPEAFLNSASNSPSKSQGRSLTPVRVDSKSNGLDVTLSPNNKQLLSSKSLPTYMSSSFARDPDAEEARHVLQDLSDPMLQVVAGRMGEALVSFFKGRGMHHNIEGNWPKFFEAVDEEGKGKITFEDLDSGVRTKLGANITRYEMRIFWNHMDADGSGLVTLKEFSDIMYRLKLAAWFDLKEPRLAICVKRINDAAEKWHRCGGNWFKIFNSLLPANENTGSINFEQFTRCIRNKFPGLDLGSDKISDDEVRGLWKLMDDDFSNDITNKEFMKFMKREGASLTMHKLTKYSQAARGEQASTRDIHAELAAAPKCSESQLAEITHRFSVRLQQYLAKKFCWGSGVHRPDAPCTTLWERLFKILDADGSGRLDFEEFESVCLTELQCEAGEGAISDDELKAVWHYVDEDDSGGVTQKEFVTGIYRLQLAECPVLDAKTIAKHVVLLNNAADKWHRCPGNWFKVFRACRSDGEADMDFSELEGFVRNSFPCLAITDKQLPYEELKGLWRCLDEDAGGTVDAREFMLYMRTHGPAFTKLTDYSKKARGLCTEEKEKEAKVLPSIKRSRERLQEVACLLDEALAAYWANRGVHHNIAGNWGRFFSEADEDGSGRLDFEELESFLMKKLRDKTSDVNDVIKGVPRDDLIALWQVVDEDGSGEVTAKEWDKALYTMEVETWPDTNDDTLKKVVDCISNAAGKWHRCAGNWYKIFQLANHGGSMSYFDLQALVYESFPDLGITTQKLPEAKLKGLWKAMDADRNERVDRQCFLVFMRRHASEKFHMSFSQIRAKANKKDEGLNTMRPLSSDQIDLLTSALNRQNPDAITSALERRKGLNGFDGFVSEWDILFIIREILCIREDEIDDDGIHFAWSSMEKAGNGRQITLDTLMSCGQAQEVEPRFNEWPTGR